MMRDFGDGGFEIVRRIISAETAVVKASRLVGRAMGEGRHDIARPLPVHPPSGGHQIQIADRLGDPRIGLALGCGEQLPIRSEEHTSELQSLMRNSYAVFCLK